MNFSVIVACTPNGGIGCKGQIPWHLPPDLKYFAQVTTATDAPEKRNAVIMGRKTWDTLPVKPLPKRQNIVISRTYTGNDMCEEKDVWVCQDLDAALERAKQSKMIESAFVIGGGEIYKIALQHEKCNKVFLTCVQDDNFEFDSFFPIKDLVSRFKLVEIRPKQTWGHISYHFEVYHSVD